MMLFRLLANGHWQGVRNTVVSLMDLGPLAAQFEDFGIHCYGLGMSRGSLSFSGCRKLHQLLSSERPDVVQTWMYHANFVGGIAARMARVPRVFWGIHHANLSPSLNKRSTLLIARVCARISRLIPDRTVFCSHVSAELHWNLGYAKPRSVVIPNGFDTELFQPDPEARLSLRKELDLPQNAMLIGFFARFDILKDHRTFCRAASLVHDSNIHFVLAGNGITRANSELFRWLQEAGLEERAHLLGLRHDMPRLCAAVDLLTSSSAGEAFPNIIGETMACAVPCVVTEVGDCAAIVGNCGIVVPAGNPSALAAGWRQLLAQSADERRALGESARNRILERFGIGNIAARYRALYSDSLSDCPT